MAPHIEGLKQYSHLLGPLIDVARSGFPAHGDLRTCILQLNTELDILGVEPAFAWRAASEATDMFRIMAKHLYNLRKSGEEVPGLDHIISKIMLPSDMGHAASSDSLDPEQVDKLFTDMPDIEEEEEEKDGAARGAAQGEGGGAARGAAQG